MSTEEFECTGNTNLARREPTQFSRRSPRTDARVAHNILQPRILLIRLGFTLLTSARTNQNALSMLLSYCSTVCLYVERDGISTVTWALTSRE
jgi:hypothetical protein